MDNVKKDRRQKYDEKEGVVSKSYKLPKDVVNNFARACEVRGISMSKALQQLMVEFISSTDLSNRQGGT